jgi:hypothetical protein
LQRLCYNQFPAAFRGLRCMVNVWEPNVPNDSQDGTQFVERNIDIFFGERSARITLVIEGFPDKGGLASKKRTLIQAALMLFSCLFSKATGEI